MARRIEKQRTAGPLVLNVKSLPLNLNRKADATEMGLELASKQHPVRHGLSWRA